MDIEEFTDIDLGDLADDELNLLAKRIKEVLEERAKQRVLERARRIAKVIPFKDVIPGMIGEDYGDNEVVIVKTGTLFKLQAFFLNGQAGYEDAKELHKDGGLPNQYVAFVYCNETRGFDHSPGLTYVLPYHDSGVICLADQGQTK